MARILRARPPLRLFTVVLIFCARKRPPAASAIVLHFDFVCGAFFCSPRIHYACSNQERGVGRIKVQLRNKRGVGSIIMYVRMLTYSP